jgi:hypothetical protein
MSAATSSKTDASADTQLSPKVHFLPDVIAPHSSGESAKLAPNLSVLKNLPAVSAILCVAGGSSVTRQSFPGAPTTEL